MKKLFISARGNIQVFKSSVSLQQDPYVQVPYKSYFPTSNTYLTLDLQGHLRSVQQSRPQETS